MKPQHVVVLVAAAAAGILSLGLAQHDPQAALGGASIPADLVLLGTGWALIVCGIAAWVRRPGSRFGRLLVAAGFAWFLAEFNNPGAGSEALFTTGLVTYAVCPVLVAHAALAYPGGALPGAIARAAIALGYASTILALGLAPTLLVDPMSHGCSQCPHDMLAVASQPALASVSSVAGLDFGLVWTLGVIALALVGIARASPAARLVVAPVVLSAAAYLGLVAADYGHSIGRGFLSTDALDDQLWFGQAVALAALTLGVAATWARARHARTTISRLVVHQAESRGEGGLRETLAATLADPALQLAYPLRDGRYVDASGRRMELRSEPGRAVTPLLRGSRTVAVLIHRADLLEDRGLLEEVGAAARLALERERLHAEVRAQLEQLRASRARNVETADVERRRLERNLHDGAQQRLVVLALAMGLLRPELEDEAAAELDAAGLELREALGELRELARGIYPAVLTDEGLGAAIQALAEEATVPVMIDGLPTERLPPAVEAAGYFLVAEVIRRAVTSMVNVSVRCSEGGLLVEMDSAGTLTGDLVDLEDRIGALDGELAVVHSATGHTTIRAEIPCVS